MIFMLKQMLYIRDENDFLKAKEPIEKSHTGSVSECGTNEENFSNTLPRLASYQCKKQ